MTATLPIAETTPSPAVFAATDVAAALTGRQKAAILLLQLGRDASSKVLGQFDETELEELGGEIARMGEIPPEVSSRVLLDFAGTFTAEPTAAHGGMALARDMLMGSLGGHRAEKILDRVAQSVVDVPFHFMHRLDPRLIVSFLADEHPQTIALVLAHIPAAAASSILGLLNGELQGDVARRVAVMDRTSPDLIRQVEQSLHKRLSMLGVSSDLSTVGGLRPLVDIINRADRGTEKLILEGLEKRDKDLADRVRNQMFMFEDLVGLDDRAIQLVLRGVQASDLALALKGESGAVRQRITQNMSERAAVMLAEEIALLGPVRVQAVEEAQAGVVRVIRELEEQGQIDVRRGDDEEFVA